jgi:hypothetical protein
VHKERVGTWEISCLTTGHVPTWSASGRRGVVADDARARRAAPALSPPVIEQQPAIDVQPSVEPKVEPDEAA